ncbi:LOW QUALITY PROTEIN: uncharacterized protein C1orf167 homolog [Vulpes vulpes]|uniref:LOW QUALITY PROTEIN: uncharacterized protein C1orf167 homolog n=1 Tax=Vulpes vulpes TaxID=9627 RepID=A0ABM4ZFS0_VULVU
MPPGPGRSEQRRWPKSLDASPGRGPGRGAPTCGAQRFPSPSPGAVLRWEPGRVQSNLAVPSLVPTDGADRLMNSSPQQQSNLLPPARPQGRARDPAVQQSNLSARGAGLAGGRRCSPRPPPELQESIGAQGSPWPPGSLACPSSTLRSPRLLATDAPCPDVPPAAGLAPFNRRAQPDSGPWGGLWSGPSRLAGEPLTLEDLTVPVHGRAQAPSHTAVHQLLASVRHLERAVARLRCRPSQEAPGPAQRAPWSSLGQALAVPRQPGRPGLAPWGGRKEHPGRLGGSADCPETRGSQAGPAGSQASRRPASSLEATLGTLAGDCLAPKDGVLPATPQRQGESSPGPPRGSWQRRDPQLPPGAGSREARRCSWARSSAARGAPPGWGGGEVAPQEQSSREEERTASWPPDAAPAGSGLQQEASPTHRRGRCRGGCPGPSRFLGPRARPALISPGLAPCFRAWWRWVQRRRAAAAVVAGGRRQLLRRGLWALRGALRLRQAQLDAAWGRHTRALLAQSFRKWRNQTLRQKQGQRPVQAGPGPPRPGPGGGQDPSGRGPEVDPARSSSPARGGIGFSPGNFPRGPESQREEAAAWPGPDGGDGGAQMLQALGQLAVFLLWCHQKKWARQDRGAQRENPRVPLRTQGMGRPPEAWRSHAVDAPRAASPDTQPRRAWLVWGQGGRGRPGPGAPTLSRQLPHLHMTNRFRGPSGLSKASAVARGRWLSLPSSLVPAPPRLPRCFGAWQRFAQRGAGFREWLAHRRAHTLRLCLQQWLRMRRLRASDGAKVTQLSLCRQKAGSVTLCGPAPGVAPARGLGVVAWVQAPAQEQGRGSLQEACRRLALQRALLLWRTRLSQRRRPDISDRALRQLQHMLSGGHLTAQGLSASAPELLGSLPGGEPWLGGRPLRSSPQQRRAGGAGLHPPSQAFRVPAPLETLGLSFRWASGQRRKGRCLRLWQVQARQSRGAATWCRRALQRRVLVGWSRWASAQGAQRQVAVGWARGRCGRAALRWWRQRLAQRLEVEQRVRARGRALARGALQRWRTCWQRQQFLHGKYQRWVQVHRQGLRRSVFQRWRRAAARRRRPGAPPEQLLLHSHSLAWPAVVRDAGALPTTGAFRGGPGEARGAAWAVWQGARAAEAWARERRVAWASVGRWRKRVQERRADRQLRRARAQQAFAAWRVALGQRCRVRQLVEERADLSRAPRAQGSCLHRGSRAQAARKLSARALGAWAQVAAKGRVQRAAVTQFPQAGSRRLLWTHRALHLEPQAETQEALAGDPGVANKGCLPALPDTPAPRKQVCVGATSFLVKNVSAACSARQEGSGAAGGRDPLTRGRGNPRQVHARAQAGPASGGHRGHRGQQGPRPWARFPLPLAGPRREAGRRGGGPGLRRPAGCSPDPPPRPAARPRPEHRRTGAETGDPRAQQGDRPRPRPRPAVLCTGLCRPLSWRRPAPAPPGPPRRAARRTPSGPGLPGPRPPPPGRRRGEAAGEEVRAALAPRGVASPAPGLGAGQAPGSDMAALGRCSGRGAAGTDAGVGAAPPQPPPGLRLMPQPLSSALTPRNEVSQSISVSVRTKSEQLGVGRRHLHEHTSGPPPPPPPPAPAGHSPSVLRLQRGGGQHWARSPPAPTAEAVAPEVGLACVAAAGPAAAGGSAVTATRRWLGPFPASQVRICSEPVHLAWGRAGWLAGVDGRVSSSRWAQAFEKWCQHLAARGQKRGATSSLITAGLRSLRSGCKLPEPVCVWWTWGGAGDPAAAVTCSHGKKNNTEPSLPKEETMPHPSGECRLRPPALIPQPGDRGLLSEL